MVHKVIFDIYKMLFGEKYSDVETWFPNGKDSIRVRLKGKQELIFTYHDYKTWSLETVDMFLKRTKTK